MIKFEFENLFEKNSVVLISSPNKIHDSFHFLQISEIRSKFLEKVMVFDQRDNFK